MEAVIWTDVMQSVIMIGGISFISFLLTREVFSGSDFLIQNAFDANKFSLGETKLSLSSRTIWVMIIYGVTENIRNLIADQNYIQKYHSHSENFPLKLPHLLFQPISHRTAFFIHSTVQ